MNIFVLANNYLFPVTPGNNSSNIFLHDSHFLHEEPSPSCSVTATVTAEN